MHKVAGMNILQALCIAFFNVDSYKLLLMGAPSLDSEFMEYWLRLTSVEKESLLSVAKHYIALKDEVGRVSVEQYNQELSDAMAQIDAGDFFTQEQVIAMSQNWLSGR